MLGEIVVFTPSTDIVPPLGRSFRIASYCAEVILQFEYPAEALLIMRQ